MIQFGAMNLVIFYLLTLFLTYFSAKFIYKYIEQTGVGIGKKIIISMDKQIHSQKNIS